MKEVILEINKRFKSRLDEKTGWGKNEIKSLHDEVVIEVLAENLPDYKY